MNIEQLKTKYEDHIAYFWDIRGFPGISFEVLCPYCREHHIHGTGGSKYSPSKINYGFRTADCGRGDYLILKKYLTKLELDFTEDEVENK